MHKSSNFKIPIIYNLPVGSELLIREAHPDDSEEIISYVNQVGGETDFLTFTKGEFTKTVEEERSILQSYLDVENQIYLVAVVDNKIIGLLNLAAKQKPRLRHVGEMGVSVLKDFWGLGIGRLLVESLLQWAYCNPIIKKINLLVVENNLRAIELYKRIGFKEEGRFVNDFYLDDAYYDGITMGIWLGE